MKFLSNPNSNIYNMYKKILIAAAGSFCFITAMAQRDTTRPSVNIVSSYRPVLRNAVKINFSGSQLLADTASTVRPYIVPAQNLFYSYQPIALRPLALQQDSNLYLGNRNFVKVGFGNYTTPYVKAGLGFGDGKTFLANFYGSFISSKGKIKNQDYAMFDAKATGSYFGKKTEVYGAASVSQRNYYLYGYDHSLYDYKKDEVKQHLQNVTVKAGIKNKISTQFNINYNPTVELNLFSNVGKLNETTVIVNAPVEKRFAESFALKVEANADITNYYTKNYSPANLNFSNNIFSIAPSLKYMSQRLTINGGVTPTWNNSDLKVLPNIYAEFQLKEKVFMIQAGWIGHYNKNTYRNLTALNPYLATLTAQTNTKEVEYYGGIKASLGSHFNFSAKAGLVQYENMQFFINDTATDGKAFILTNEPSVNNFRVHGDLSYISQNKFTATAAVTFNGYTGMDANARAWNTVPVEISASLRWWAFRQILLKADFYSFGGGNYLSKGNLSYKFKSGADLSAGAEFRITKKFSAWLDVNNIFNNKYERWHGYQVYGLNLLGGVRYDF